MPPRKRSVEQIVDNVAEPITKRLRSDKSNDQSSPRSTTQPDSVVSEYNLKWSNRGTMYVLDSAPQSTNRILGNSIVYAFDMDSTLITTKSGKLFPTSRQDWKWLFPEVPIKLKALYDDGAKLVIFTNQNGISTGTSSAASIQGKICDIINSLGVPMQAFIASADDLHRKPSTNMWRDFTQHHNDGVVVDLEKSIYVGDAAGRPAKWNGKADTKKDHSAADRKFAKNVGLPFATPEPFFLGHKESHYEMDADLGNLFRAMIEKDTKAALQQSPGKSATVEVSKTVEISSSSDVVIISSSTSTTITTTTDTTIDTTSDTTASDQITNTASNDHAQPHQELVIFVGFPAAGKTTFAKKHFVKNGYVHINRDTMKTADKCVAAAGAAIARGESCVVDNTNPNRADRAKYIAFAKRKGIPVRCYQFMTTEAEAKHLNMFREKLTNGQHKHVSRIAYSVYKKNLAPPTLDEGFTVIKQVHFYPEFASDEAKKLFSESS